MANSKKTKRLLEVEIGMLRTEEAKQQKIVDDLRIKKDQSSKYYDEAFAKLNDMKDTLASYKKDKDK